MNWRSPREMILAVGLMKYVRMLDRILLPALVVCVAASGAAFAGKSGPPLGDNEVKLGTEGAAEVAKQNKLSDNAVDLAHLREMGQKIAAIANQKEPRIAILPEVQAKQVDVNGEYRLCGDLTLLVRLRKKNLPNVDSVRVDVFAEIRRLVGRRGGGQE